MKPYKDLIQNILDNGTFYETNKGKCLGVIGAQVKYDITNSVPIVTGSKFNFTWAAAEYIMFLKGITHVDFLKQYGAEKIWESQSLSKDITGTKRRPVDDVINDYAKKTGITEEEAKIFFYKRLEEYEARRSELNNNPPLIEVIDEETGELVQHSVDVNKMRNEIFVLEDFLTEPFIKTGVEISEEVIIHSKGSLGPIYGQQWRAWKAVTQDGKIVTIDQIKSVVEKLKENPESRQIMLTSWNPAFIISEKYSYDEKIANGFMGQPPCHVNYHFLTRLNPETGERELHTTVWLRSNDVMLGHKFNVFGAGIISHLIANSVEGLVAKSITMQISDAHIYENQLANVQKYLDSEIFEQPIFRLSEVVNVFNVEVEDILNAIGEYKHGPYISYALNTNDNTLSEGKTNG